MKMQLLIGISLSFTLLAQAEQPNVGKPDSEPSYTIDYKASKVVKQNSVGTVLWTVSFDGRAGSARPPDIVWDTERVYFTLNDGVTALSANSGKELWHSEGPNHTLLLSGDLLVASGGYRDSWSFKWLLARSPVDGKEKFKLSLPEKSDPVSITEIGKLFVISDDVHDKDKIGMKTMLVDRNGSVKAKFDRQIVNSIIVGSKLIVLTNKDVMRLSAELKELWLTPFDNSVWEAGGSLLEIPGGDLIAYRYGCINDSGVDLMRLEPKTGKLLWSNHCDGLGVAHSKYGHEATVVILGNKVVVDSKGTYGTFTETLDLDSGEQLTRNTERKKY